MSDTKERFYKRLVKSAFVRGILATILTLSVAGGGWLFWVHVQEHRAIANVLGVLIQDYNQRHPQPPPQQTVTPAPLPTVPPAAGK